MRKWLNNYFDFTKSEFNGLLVLLVLIAMVTTAPYAYALLKKDEFEEQDYLIVKKLILNNETKTNADHFEHKSNAVSSRSSASSKKRLFNFDPNLIGQSDWVRLGLSSKQASSIMKYISKGGQFKQVEDLKKMYTISPEKYAELLPYVRIVKNNYPQDKNQHNPNQPSESQALATTTNKNSGTFINYPKKAAIIVEINAADSAALDDISGIGPAFAIRILTYRQRIGGFVNKEQLMEVFGLDSLKYAEIKGQVRVDATAIKKIDINTITIDNFKNHPYLRFKQINAIIQYRKQHGNYSNIAELSKVMVIPAETIARLAPYLIY